MTNDRIQQHVEDALDWADPCVDGSRISVSVARGVVTLRGSVDTRSEKATAERVARMVRGVRSVVSDLAVRDVAGLRSTGAGIGRMAVTHRSDIDIRGRRLA